MLGLESVAERWERRPPLAAAADEVLVYGPIVDDDEWAREIGGMTARMFREQMQGRSGVTVRLNSPGGDVWEASAMQVVLAETQAQVVVDGLAASAAGFLALSGAGLAMAPLSALMLHQAHCLAWGVASDLRAAADMLDGATRRFASAVAARMRTTPDELCARLASTEDIWIGAEEALASGIADRILDAADRSAAAPPPPPAAVSARAIRLARMQAD